ncbi:MAG: tetratricopeptide repeat protein, partial [Bacteroidota bacterium]
IPLTYNQLTNIYLALGLPEAAEPYATEAYRLWIRNFGLISNRGITASRLLSRLYNNLGQLSKGLLYHEEAVRSAQTFYAGQNQQLIGYYKELSNLYKDMGYQEQYLIWVNKADSMVNMTADLPAHTRLTYLHSRAKLLHDEFDQSEAAIQLIKKVISQYEAIPNQQGYHLVNVANFKTTLAQILKSQKRYPEARQYLGEAHAVFDSLYPSRSFYAPFEWSDIAYLEKDQAAFEKHAKQLLSFFVKPREALSLPELLQADIQAYPDANSMKVLLRLADRFWQSYQRDPTEESLQLTILAFEQLDRWYDPYHREEVQYAYRLSEYRSWIYKGLLRSYVAD